MGTNYYWHESGEYECPHCKRRTPSLHVGKSSAGWCFSLRIHPAEGIRELADWRAKWATGGAIFNEYGDKVSPAELLEVITERETRTAPDVYAHEMTEDHHIDLLTALTEIEGRFMLSGYRSKLYDDHASIWRWTRQDFDVANHSAGGSEKRRMTECLWCNFQPPVESGG